MRAAVVVGAGILALGLALAEPAAACTEVCLTPDNYEVMLRTYKRVLVGRVEVAPDNPYRTTFVVKPIRVWKGRKKEITLASLGLCSITPRVGKLYVVFASEDPQPLSACSPVLGLWEADIVGGALDTDDRQFQLRAERLGTGTGRTYTITYAATDASGNSTRQSTTVTVPHDQRPTSE